MGRVSFSMATRPLFCTLHVSLMVSVAETCDKTAWYYVKKTFSFFLALGVSGLLCFLGLLEIVFLFWRLRSAYHTIYFISGAILTLWFRWGCQKSFRSFFADFESYRQQYCLDGTRYVFVSVCGIVSLVYFVGLSTKITVMTIYHDHGSCYTSFETMPEFVVRFICHPVVYWLSKWNPQIVFSVQFWLYICVWRFLKTEANKIVQAVSDLNKKPTAENAPDVIERIRLRHAELCRFMSRANHFFSPMFATVFVSGVVYMLLVVREIIHDPGVLAEHSMDNLDNLMNRTISLLIVLAVFTLTAVNLNLKMHEPVDHLFQMDVLRMSERGSEVVSRFVARLQGAPIAFDILRIVNVDPSIILMLCGTVMTYVIVIIQFETPTVSCSTDNLQQLLLQILDQHNASFPEDFNGVNVTSSVPLFNATTSTP